MNLRFRFACLFFIPLLPACGLVPGLSPLTVVTMDRTSMAEVATDNDWNLAGGPEGVHYWHIGMLSSDLEKDDLAGIAQDFSTDPWGYTKSATQRLRLTSSEDETVNPGGEVLTSFVGEKCTVEPLGNGIFRIALVGAAEAHVPQTDPQTCWSACVVTYANLVFGNTDADQLRIANRFNLVGGEGDRGGDLFRILLGLESLQKRGNVWSTAFAGTAGASLVLAPSADSVVASLLAGQPMIAGLPGDGAGAGHAVVIVGGDFASYQTTSGSPVWRAHSISVLDPAYQEGPAVLSQADLTGGFLFYVNHMLAATLLENIDAVQSGREQSLEEQGFTILDTAKGLLGG